MRISAQMRFLGFVVNQELDRILVHKIIYLLIHLFIYLLTHSLIGRFIHVLGTFYTHA